eukprot:CAMPEP_0179436046 /NCGR_PEP_ID=MMETSP0799-20121207/20063_1 /TAXON_ID=46947 /ORGANISM="Geminigera cryophila, Strain CCMP2564" /LENGTH=205 /DNA_ID=CAMNT_0021215839 /DNA_START=289 /DNA_END=907 /DNA_ORIENTATION=+
MSVISQKERVQNNFLQSQYKNKQRCMEVVNGESEINEKKLFHGTSRWDPQVLCTGNQGFDPRVSNDGFYGQGVYFAQNPDYSHLYAHRVRKRTGSSPSLCTSEEVFQIVLASVACGISKDFGPQVDGDTRKLRRPPPRPSDQTTDQTTQNDLLFAGDTLFDSVRAGPHGNEHGSSIMYIVYDSLQAAPDYLITYVWRDDMDLDSD